MGCPQAFDAFHVELPTNTYDLTPHDTRKTRPRRQSQCDDEAEIVLRKDRRDRDHKTHPRKSLKYSHKTLDPPIHPAAKVTGKDPQHKAKDHGTKRRHKGKSH